MYSPNTAEDKHNLDIQSCSNLKLNQRKFLQGFIPSFNTYSALNKIIFALLKMLMQCKEELHS